ncbi:MAG: AAA family ATPase [Solirubrobacterales bacterium]|nr:AAA family ATPase [Solirubrobacterales bacterium]
MTTNVPVFERDREIAAIGAAVELATQGQGSLVVVKAGAGFGKTRLLEEARDHLVGGEIATSFATAREIDRDLPFGLVRELFGPLLEGSGVVRDSAVFEGMASLSRPVFDSDPVENTSLDGEIHGLYWLISNLSEERTFALFVDDIQWADEQSARWLAHLSARVGDLPVALIVAARTGEPELDQNPLSSTLDLARTNLTPEPLSAEAVQLVMASHLNLEIPESFAKECRDATGGNAFLVTQLSTALESSGVRPADADVEEIAAYSPATLSRRLIRRINREGPHAMALVEALEILGDETPVAQLFELAGVGPAEGASLLDRLDRLDLIEAGSRPRFSHSMVREAVRQEIGPTRRVVKHREAIRIRVAAGDPSEKVAPHLLIAHPDDRDSGVGILVAAAAAANGRGAPTTASELLDRAVEIAGDQTDQDLRLARARAHARANNGEAAGLLLAEAEAIEDSKLSFSLKLEAARVFYSAGAWNEAIDLLQSCILEMAEIDPELSLVASSNLVGILLFVPATDRTALKEHGLAEPYPGDTPGERAMLAARAAQLMMDVEGSAEDAADTARRAWSGGKLLEDEGPGGIAWSYATGALAAADCYKEGEELLSRVLGVARLASSSHTFASASYCRACPRLFRGAIKASLADAEAAVATHEDGWEIFYPLSLVVAARCRIELGQADLAGQTLSLIAGESQSLDTLMSMTWDLAHCDLALEAGDILSAGRLLEKIQSEAGGHRSPFALSDVNSTAATLERMKGRDAAAQELLFEQLDLVLPWGAPRLIGSTLRDLGLTVRGETGLGHTEEAVATLRDTEVLLGLGYALNAHGVLLRETGRTADAEEAQFEALGIGAECGSVRLESRTRAELGLLGRRPRRIRRTGVAALTASEERVAKRAAAGMTNREIGQELFVSVKTVEKHLANTYSKLRIPSRRELAAALSDGQRTG